MKLVGFIHSEDWRSRDDFHRIPGFYTDLATVDSVLTEVLLKDVRNYAARTLSGAAALDEPRIKQAANFVLEEIAGCHLHSDGYPVFHIYPGGELDSCDSSSKLLSHAKRVAAL